VKLAVQDSLLPGADLSEKMHAAAVMGFDAVELRAGELLNGWPQLRRALRQLALPVSSICTNPQQDLVVEEREVREARLATLRQLIEIASRLGARGVIIVPIRRPHRLPDLTPLYTSSDLEMALLYRLFDDLVPLAEQAGVALLIEICKHYDSAGLRLMADTFHMNIMEADPLASLRAATPYLAHMHLSDSNRQLPGQGHIDFRALFMALADIGYTGYLALEAIPPADPIVATEQSLRFLRAAMQGAVTD